MSKKKNKCYEDITGVDIKITEYSAGKGGDKSYSVKMSFFDAEKDKDIEMLFKESQIRQLRQLLNRVVEEIENHKAVDGYIIRE